MHDTSSYIALISGQRRGPMRALCRGALRLAAWKYTRLIKLRNAYYDTWAMPTWLDVPVISVGNLTVGGTGKTPMTIWLCERMLERGRKPAVLSRGYKASQEGLADEMLLVSRRCPKAVAVAHADRVLAGRMAIAEFGVQAAILDDGFQHRRLGRDLDLVLIDATRPFGFEYVLPRGLLREPISSLRRADAIIITRADQVEPAAIERITAQVREWQREAPIVRAVHQPAGFVDLAGQSMTLTAGRRVGCFAGIARPEAFVRTMTDLGFPPSATRWYDDHHAYSLNDVRELCTWAADERVEVLATTEKDAVKLAALDADWPLPLAVLRIDIALLDDGDKILTDLIDRMLADHIEAEVPKDDASHGPAAPTE